MDTGSTFRSELTCKSRLVPMSDGQVNRDSEGRPYGQILHPRKQSLGPTRQLEAVEFPKLKSRGPVSRLRPFFDINIKINDTTMTMTMTIIVVIILGQREWEVPVSSSPASLEDTAVHVSLKETVQWQWHKYDSDNNNFTRTPMTMSRSLASLERTASTGKTRLYTFPWRRRSTASHLNQQALRIGQAQAQLRSFFFLGRTMIR